jgi:PAS domain S-box-containing protein
VYEDSNEGLQDQLWEAVRAGLIFSSEASYRFLHDRVQEAAYLLIPEQQRAQAHLRIGRILAQSTPPERLEESIFDIVNQIDRGSRLITDVSERERAAELNLIAAKRAKASAAFDSALKYLHAGRSLLSEEAWDRTYGLTFSLESLIAECELLTADMAAAESRLAMLAKRAGKRHDVAIVTRLQITLYTTLDRSDRAIDVFLDYLLGNGVSWSRHPRRDEVMQEYHRIWSLVGSREIEDLVDLPLLDDPDVLDMLDVFGEIVHPAMFFDENLSTLVVCRMVCLCLEHGNCDASCFGFVWFGMFAGPRFENYQGGFRFGQLGYDLVEKRNLTRYQARTYISFGTLTPWAKHALQGRELIRRAFDVAFRTGDLTFSAYSWHSLIANYLVVGDTLSEVHPEAEKGLNFVSKAGFGLVTENCRANLALIRTLRGLTAAFGCFDTDDYNESQTEQHFAINPGLALAEFFYWTRKLQARFFAGDHTSAVDASRKAHRLLWPAASQVETGDFRFFAALAEAAAWNAAPVEQRQAHRSALEDHRRQLQTWARHCPANFDTKFALANAEAARIDGQTLEAEQFYEAAILAGRENGFVHCEAIANECAAQFYAARGLAKISQVYWRDARDCYRSWGADGKVRQLDELYPGIRAAHPSSDTGTILTSVEQLDLSTVIRVWEAVSGETEHEKLIDALMRTAIEYAGAERGLLILPLDGGHRIEAEATMGADGVVVALHQKDISGTDLPVSVFQFVLRSRESLHLQDATVSSSFSSDEYIRQRRTRSVLCLPLLKQAQLLGVLYLENNLAGDVFTPARTTVLKLLASAAAVSLENTRLYRELLEREARVRRLVESNIIGIFIWRFDGHVIDANEAFLRIVGRDRADLLAGRLDWRELTPAEWRQRDDQALADVKLTGIAETYEKELIRKDGRRIPVLAGAAVFDGVRQEGVAFIIDLSDRRRAEEAARDSERRYYEIQIQLEHANRVATLGQLSASIAHEVSQPITGVMTNAHTVLLGLRHEVPDLDAMRQAVSRIVRDSGRAADVVARIRALARKAPAQRDPVHINDAIEDVVALTHSEVTRSQIICRTLLSPGLPAVAADRVQIQQVILNLIMNAVEALNLLEGAEREIVVSSLREADTVRVAVRDSGRGVDEKERERIFDAFYSTKPSGLGMGLSICRSIIAAHGGQLWVSNAAPRGAVFEFTLPVEQPLLGAH